MRRSTRTRRPPTPSQASAPPEPRAPSWLADLRVQVDDITAAALDATSPPGKRTLGRSEARRQILEAAGKCRAIFALAQEPAS